MSLTERFARATARSPDKLALRSSRESGAPETLTYGELMERSSRAAGRISELGVQPGDRVALLLGNRVETVSAGIAILGLGAAIVPMNLAYRRRELEHIVADAQPCLVLTDVAHRERLEKIAVAAREHLSIATVEELGTGHRPAPIEPARVPGSATALILYTSGTTGRTKGAVLSHDNVAATIASLHEAWAWTPDDELLLALPLFHTHGLIVGLYSALAAGAAVSLEQCFETSAVLDALLSGEPTLFFGVPTMYVRLLDEMGRRHGELDLSHMRLFCSGSAALDPEVFSAFRKLTGHEILERYGMTETGMLLSNPYSRARIPGTVGRELPGVEARILGTDDEEMATGEAGELVVRGANVFSGYWRSPEKTRESFTIDVDGRAWFRTGDLARRDPSSGHYTLLGRRHELIISGGLNVYPREVEETLTTIAGIREAAVVGHPHPEWGERVVAYVVADGSLDEAAVVEHCKRQMASFKVPRRIHRLEALPRNALGKIQKHLLPPP